MDTRISLFEYIKKYFNRKKLHFQQPYFLIMQIINLVKEAYLDYFKVELQLAK